MTRSVWVVAHQGKPCLSIIADTKEAAWMQLYASHKVPIGLPDAHIAAMSEYASDHKAAQAQLGLLGFSVVPAKLKIEEEPK